MEEPRQCRLEPRPSLEQFFGRLGQALSPPLKRRGPPIRQVVNHHRNRFRRLPPRVGNGTSKNPPSMTGCDRPARPCGTWHGCCPDWPGFGAFLHGCSSRPLDSESEVHLESAPDEFFPRRKSSTNINCAMRTGADFDERGHGSTVESRRRTGDTGNVPPTRNRAVSLKLNSSSRPFVNYGRL